MADADKRRALANVVAALARVHHEALAVELFGRDAAGLTSERVHELIATGMIDPDKLGGWLVPGMHNDADPFLFLQMVAKVMERTPDAERHLMRRWDLAQWVEAVDVAISAAAATQAELPLAGHVRVDAHLHGLEPPEPPPAPVSATSVVPEAVEAPGWLAPMERAAYVQAKTRAGEFCRGLGNAAGHELERAVAEEWSGEDIVQEVQPDRRRGRIETIRTAVSDALAGGKDAKELARDLANATGDWSHNWERVARTELQGAYNEGVVIDALQTHGPDAQVARVPETGACEHCLRLFLADGRPQVFPVRELVGNGTNVARKPGQWRATIWPIHPHCLPADAQITTARGSVAIHAVVPGDWVATPDRTWRRVTHSRRSLYFGRWVTVQTAQHEIHATAGHLLLTARGWLPAQEIQRGDHLVCEPLNVSGGSGAVDAHAQDQPAGGCEAQRFLRVLTGFSRSGVPVAAVHFDGEFFVWEGQVDVVDVEGMRNNREHPTLLEDVCNALFVRGLKFAGSAARIGEAVFMRCRLSAHGVMRCARPSTTLVGCRLLLAQEHGGTSGSLPQALLTETSDDDAAVHVQTSSYLLDREVLVEVHPADSFGIDVAACGHGAIETTTAEVVNVVVSDFAGPVFNLTVFETGSYFANGAGSHNCRCGTLVVPRGFVVTEDGRLRPE